MSCGPVGLLFHRNYSRFISIKCKAMMLAEMKKGFRSVESEEALREHGLERVEFEHGTPNTTLCGHILHVVSVGVTVTSRR